MSKTLMLTLLLSGLILLLVPATASANGIQVIDIYAGQHTLVGNLIVEENGGNLDVTYQITTPGWCFEVTHLYVGDDPPASSAPGQFPYHHEGLPCVLTDTFSVPGDSNSYIAAHAEVNFSTSNAAPLVVPTGDVTFSVSSAFPGSPAYFNPTSTSGALNGSFNGWCVDVDNQIFSGVTYSATLYSTLDGGLPAGLVDKPQNLDLVNYILNQDYITQGMTYGDVQRAMWELIDDLQSDANLNTWTPANVEQILTEAAQFGEGFEPICGQTMAVILDPHQANVQHTIIEYVIPCIAHGPDRDETAWALADNVVLFGQGWGGYFSASMEDVPVVSSGTPGSKADHPGNGNNGNGNGPPPHANNNNNNGGGPPPHANNDNQQAQSPTWSSSEPVTEAASITPIFNLTACRVETNYVMNLRAGPGTEFDIIRQVPWQARMDATLREGDWFSVAYWNGYEFAYGWLLGSNNYLKLLGNCRT